MIWRKGDDQSSFISRELERYSDFAPVGRAYELVVDGQSKKTAIDEYFTNFLGHRIGTVSFLLEQYPRSFALGGPPGVGKTTSLKWHAQTLLWCRKSCLDNEDPTWHQWSWPIYVDMRHHAERFEDYVRSEVETVTEGLSSQSLRLFPMFDNLDRSLYCMRHSDNVGKRIETLMKSLGCDRWTVASAEPKALSWFDGDTYLVQGLSFQAIEQICQEYSVQPNLKERVECLQLLCVPSVLNQFLESTPSGTFGVDEILSACANRPQIDADNTWIKEIAPLEPYLPVDDGEFQLSEEVRQDVAVRNAILFGLRSKILNRRRANTYGLLRPLSCRVHTWAIAAERSFDSIDELLAVTRCDDDIENLILHSSSDTALKIFNKLLGIDEYLAIRIISIGNGISEQMTSMALDFILKDAPEDWSRQSYFEWFLRTAKFGSQHLDMLQRIVGVGNRLGGSALKAYLDSGGKITKSELEELLSKTWDDYNFWSETSALLWQQAPTEDLLNILWTQCAEVTSKSSGIEKFGESLLEFAGLSAVIESVQTGALDCRLAQTIVLDYLINHRSDVLFPFVFRIVEHEMRKPAIESMDKMLIYSLRYKIHKVYDLYNQHVNDSDSNAEFFWRFVRRSISELESSVYALGFIRELAELGDQNLAKRLSDYLELTDLVGVAVRTACLAATSSDSACLVELAKKKDRVSKSHLLLYRYCLPLQTRDVQKEMILALIRHGEPNLLTFSLSLDGSYNVPVDLHLSSSLMQRLLRKIDEAEDDEKYFVNKNVSALAILSNDECQHWLHSIMKNPKDPRSNYFFRSLFYRLSKKNPTRITEEMLLHSCDELFKCTNGMDAESWSGTLLGSKDNVFKYVMPRYQFKNKLQREVIRHFIASAAREHKYRFTDVVPNGIFLKTS